MAYVKLCKTSDVPDGESFRVEHPAGAIAIHHCEGEFFATQDRCTHDDWSLADGYLENGIIECTLHWAKFCVKTGKVKAAPACEALKIYPLRVNGDDIEVDVEAGHISV